MSPDVPVEIKEVDYGTHKSAIQEVRFTVFVDEQKVPEELEMDEWDARSIHVLAKVNGRPVGTGRLLPDGHIGRVAVLREFRGLNIGYLLMRKLMDIGSEKGFERFELSAQLQAVGFYEKIGFQKIGDVYLEAGIEHVNMQLAVASA